MQNTMFLSKFCCLLCSSSHALSSLYWCTSKYAKCYLSILNTSSNLHHSIGMQILQLLASEPGGWRFERRQRRPSRPGGESKNDLQWPCNSQTSPLICLCFEAFDSLRPFHYTMPASLDIDPIDCPCPTTIKEQ